MLIKRYLYENEKISHRPGKKNLYGIFFGKELIH